ncbi:hypothetical protein Tco_0206051 [Tanacetum coccineum]
MGGARGRAYAIDGGICGAAVVVVRGWCRRWYDDDDDDGGSCDGVKVRVVMAYGGVGCGVVVRWQRRWCLSGLRGLHYLLDKVVQAGTAPGPNQQQP